MCVKVCKVQYTMQLSNFNGMGLTKTEQGVVGTTNIKVSFPRERHVRNFRLVEKYHGPRTGNETCAVGLKGNDESTKPCGHLS